MEVGKKSSTVQNVKVVEKSLGGDIQPARKSKRVSEGVHMKRGAKNSVVFSLVALDLVVVSQDKKHFNSMHPPRGNAFFTFALRAVRLRCPFVRRAVESSFSRQT